MFPCKPGLTCIPLGGRSCLRIDGCSDDERRICGKCKCKYRNLSPKLYKRVWGRGCAKVYKGIYPIQLKGEISSILQVYTVELERSKLWHKLTIKLPVSHQNAYDVKLYMTALLGTKVNHGKDLYSYFNSKEVNKFTTTLQ